VATPSRFGGVSPARSIGPSTALVSGCRGPRDEQWVEDATEIAGALSLDADHLIAFLRTAEAIQQFGDAHPTDSAQAGRLLAARDRDEEG